MIWKYNNNKNGYKTAVAPWMIFDHIAQSLVTHSFATTRMMTFPEVSYIWDIGSQLTHTWWQGPYSAPSKADTTWYIFEGMRVFLSLAPHHLSSWWQQTPVSIGQKNSVRIDFSCIDWRWMKIWIAYIQPFRWLWLNKWGHVTVTANEIQWKPIVISFTIQPDKSSIHRSTVSSSLTPYWFYIMQKNHELYQALNLQ